MSIACKLPSFVRYVTSCVYESHRMILLFLGKLGQFDLPKMIVTDVKKSTISIGQFARDLVHSESEFRLLKVGVLLPH